MKITLETLKQFNTCEEGIDFMEKNYPNGATAIQIMEDGKADLDMLHFGYKYFPLDKEDIQCYKRICHIDDATRFCWYSRDISNSDVVVNSTNVINSKYIQNSDDVQNSNEVANSTNIKRSDNILHSRNVSDSLVVVYSTDISDSMQVQYSKHVDWSKCITHSAFVKDCDYIYKSERVSECFCSGFLKNCRHCLFCSNLCDAEYYIFNEKVSPDVYEQWAEALLEQLSVENGCMIEIDPKQYNPIDKYKITTRFDCVFNGLSDVFYGWVGTVPGVTDFKFINLFFRDYEFDK